MPTRKRACPADCIKCYLAGRKKRYFPGHGGQRKVSKVSYPFEGIMSYLKRRDKKASTDGTESFNWRDCAHLSNYPALCEFLFMHQWPDGEKRDTGTMLMFDEAGSLKVCLSDRDQSLVAFVSGDSLEELLAAAERGLRDDTLDWRPQKNSKRK